jgi:hypothetical protein
MCVARGKKRKTIKLTEHVFFYTAAGVRWIDGRAHTAFSKKKTETFVFLLFSSFSLDRVESMAR